MKTWAIKNPFEALPKKGRGAGFAHKANPVQRPSLRRYVGNNRLAATRIQRTCHCGGKCAACSGKDDMKAIRGSLQVSPAQDAFEKEADQVAAQITHTSETKAGNPGIRPAIRRIASGGRAGFEPGPDFQINTRGGRPLSDATRRFMEPRFGADFRQIRVHSGQQAQQSAAQIQAKAYTYGNNIWLGKGASESDQGLMAHELTHVVQQGGHEDRISPMIQRTQTDAGFEALSGVGTGISNGTMIEESSISGSTYTAQNCGSVAGCNIRFEFPKAYKGVYPYVGASGRDVRGIYVKISVTYNRTECGLCEPLLLIQTLRNITRGTSGNIETDQPTNSTRRERSGSDEAMAPSKGWRIDTTTSSTDPFVTSLSHTSNPGSSSTPAEFWDAPGHWTSTTNHGKEFQTCAVCQKGDGSRTTLACVNWGYYTDNAGNINFRPTAPAASCGATTELQDASARWDAISGNTATNITFP